MRNDPRWVPRVDNAPIREAVEDYLRKNEIDWKVLTNQLGWHPELGNKRVKRMLGVAKHSKHKRDTIKYDNAVKIIRAIGRSPYEFGL